MMSINDLNSLQRSIIAQGEADGCASFYVMVYEHAIT